MDLLGDIGQNDQLTSTREENRVLQAKVKELTVRMHALLAQNQALQAELELYRDEFAARPIGITADQPPYSAHQENKEDLEDDFVVAGNKIFPATPVTSFPRIHGPSNALCCALNGDDSILATGGADSNLVLCRWGLALAPGLNSVGEALNQAKRVSCGAPVICVSFAHESTNLPVVAAGSMDGSVSLALMSGEILRPEVQNITNGIHKHGIQHGKYVKTVCWSPAAPIVASASADGTLQLTRLGERQFGSDPESNLVTMEVIQSMHFEQPLEAMCFLDDGRTLCCYIRGNPFLTYIHLDNGCKQTKYSLNGSSAGTGCFDDHVSFSVLSLQPSPNNNARYMAAATDSSRNIVIKTGTNKIVRNLYGHKNDGFSNPKIAWSRSGQYLYGNSQDENCICVWDVASSSIVKRLEEKNGGHTGFVRDIYSSARSDTVATVSFDKTAKVWLNNE